MIFIVACLAVMLPVLLGGLFAWATAGMDTQVKNTTVELEERDKGYNPALTFDHKIKAQADSDTQMKEARKLAAQQAAGQRQRGANMRIGRLGHENLNTAGDAVALEADPVTAVRIATYHGWDGAKTGAVAAAAAPAAVAAGPAATGKIELVPGKDYPFTKITDDMAPEDKRKARIANSKAKSAAFKAAKAAGVPAAAATGSPAAAATAAAPAAATAVSIEPPVYIELTDDMEPQAKSKARIANSKAKSAFNKALKAVGIDPNDVEIVDGQVVIPGGAPVAAAAPAAEAAAPEAPAASPAAAASAIPEPEYIELTDDMEPQEKAKARIANSKAKSAYNKALKAAGIDPNSLK